MLFPVLKALLLPLLFVAGILMYHLHILTTRDADRLLKLVVTTILPTLIIGTVLPLDINPGWAWLPVSAVAMVAVVGPVAWWTAARLRLPPRTRGSFVVGAMIMNLSMVYPFVALFMDETALAMLAVFDFGHAMAVFTLVYGIACVYGSGQWRWQTVAGKIATFPPNIALALVIMLKAAGVTPPAVLTDACYMIGKWGVLAVPVALGVYFTFHQAYLKIALINLGVRCGMGLAGALIVLQGFQYPPPAPVLIIIAALAPIGFNTLIFAGKENLDKTYAATAVSVSLLMSFLYLPLLFLWLIE